MSRHARPKNDDRSVDRANRKVVDREPGSTQERLRHLQSSVGNRSVQAKLEIGSHDPSLEREADEVADQVAGAQASPTASRAAGPPDLSGVDVAAGIDATIGGGQVLPPDVRAEMESGIGADFSAVRLHTDSRADDLSRSLEARAFTTGNDVFFKAGEYDPTSSGGKHLLAHELTHVAQQQPAVINRKDDPQAESRSYSAPDTGHVVTGAGPAGSEQLAAPGVFDAFGSKHREPGVDPDVDQTPDAAGGVYLGSRRTDDAPILQSLRVVYNQLDSWSRAVPEAAESVGLRPAEYVAQVKAITKTEFKHDFRNVDELDPGMLERGFETKVGIIVDQMRGKLDQLVAWYRKHRPEAAEGKSADEILATVHQQGTEKWRKQWHETVKEVNQVLSTLWPPAKKALEAWVSQKKAEDPVYRFILGEDPIGELDYIGSLAKGYKGPPKQHVRFNPEDFDVDANLVAPPLAAYALFTGVTPDRGRIFGRSLGIPPLNDFVNTVDTTLENKIDAYKVDPKDRFDVAIVTPPTEAQSLQHEVSEVLYGLRSGTDPVSYHSLIQDLFNAGLLEGTPAEGREASWALRKDFDVADMTDLAKVFEKNGIALG